MVEPATSVLAGIAKESKAVSVTVSVSAELAAVFVAGYLWGGEALTFVCDAWQDMAEASRIKLEEVM